MVHFPDTKAAISFLAPGPRITSMKPAPVMMAQRPGARGWIKSTGLHFIAALGPLSTLPSSLAPNELGRQWFPNELDWAKSHPLRCSDGPLIARGQTDTSQLLLPSELHHMHAWQSSGPLGRWMGWTRRMGWSVDRQLCTEADAFAVQRMPCSLALLQVLQRNKAKFLESTT